MRYFKLWFIFCQQSVKRDLIYRLDFVLDLFYWILNLGIAWLTIKLFFLHTYSINGWTQSMMFSLLGLSMIVMSLASILLDRNVYGFRWLIQRGDFDHLLAYPVPTFFTSMFRYVSTLSVFGVITGLAVFLISIGNYQHDPATVALFVALVVCGIILLVILETFIATIGFWAVEPSLNDLVGQIAGTFTRYPIRVFSKCMQTALTWIVPMAFLTTIPLETLYGITPKWYLGVALGMLVVSGCALHWVWGRGVRGYSSASS
jgi:ABC-2 type transport system permease protein